MQIVINIPNSEISKQQNIIEIPLHFIDGKVCEAGGYGFDVLPKGHGRLIDVSEYFKKEFGDAREFLDKATTIIEAEADKENKK
jgi:hypothetical protein